MKELFASIQAQLEAAAGLTALVSADNIGQAGGPFVRSLPCVTYQLYTSTPVGVDQEYQNWQPSEVTLLFSIEADDDSSATYGASTLLVEIAEQLKVALEGADLSLSASLDCKAASFDAFETPPQFDDRSHSWLMQMRFRFTVAKLSA